MSARSRGVRRAALVLALAAGCGRSRPSEAAPDAGSPDAAAPASPTASTPPAASVAPDVPDVPDVPAAPADAPLDADARAEIEAARLDVLAAPDDAGARFAHAARLDANGLPELALAAWSALERVAPGDARAPYHAARALSELGRPGDALAALDRALALDPAYAPGHRRRGELLLALGRPADAREALARARALDPRDPGALVLAARAELEAGVPAEALALADRALAAAPELGVAHLLRAAALRELDRADEAERAAGLAREHGAGSVPEWSDPWERAVKTLRGGPRMRLARGRALLAAGRAAEAEALLEAEHARRPDDVGVLGAYCAALCAERRVDRARAVAANAARRLPRHERVALVASEVAAFAGDLPAALEHARRAVELQPSLALAHAQLAHLCEAAGDQQGAERARAEARRLAGDPSSASEDGW